MAKQPKNKVLDPAKFTTDVESKLTEAFSRPPIDQYQGYKANQRNVLLIGKSGQGKSTLLEFLRKDGSLIEADPVTYRQTIDPIFQPMNFNNNNNHHCQINFIDTPGLDEAASKDDDIAKRDNNTLRRLILYAIERDITHLSMIIVPLKANQTITDRDITIFEELNAFFTPEIRKHTVLVLTCAEELAFDNEERTGLDALKKKKQRIF